MKYHWILFDLDGTLTDPALGITSAVQYALERFGIHEECREKLYGFIGPTLMESFQKYYGFTPDQGREAIGYFRAYYGRQGKFENKVFEGIPAMLEGLKKMGKQLFVVTLKGEGFALEILEHFGLTQYFDGIVGQPLDGDEIPKSQLIDRVLKSKGIDDRSQMVMVGDREHDAIAAQEMNIHSIGVLYGYGGRGELEAAGAEKIVSDIKELWEELRL